MPASPVGIAGAGAVGTGVAIITIITIITIMLRVRGSKESGPRGSGLHGSNLELQVFAA